MSVCSQREICWLAVAEIGERYRRYRLPDAAAESAMVGSLARHGQISPVVVCRREERPEMLDGFKRLSATRALSGVTSLEARFVEVDEPTAKVTILGLNGTGRRMKELEEAWIVHALVREDGLSQLEVAELLGRHKSWVCRRLALLERLAEECREDLRLGLLSPTMARQLTRLPAGNQAEVMAAWDPRLSSAGNRVLRQLGGLLGALGRMENWLRHRGRADLSSCDRGVLAPSFTRLTRDARTVAELTEDLLAQIDVP